MALYFLSQSLEARAANINNCIRTNKYNHLSDEYQKSGKNKNVTNTELRLCKSVSLLTLLLQYAFLILTFDCFSIFIFMHCHYDQNWGKRAGISHGILLLFHDFYAHFFQFYDFLQLLWQADTLHNYLAHYYMIIDTLPYAILCFIDGSKPGNLFGQSYFAGNHPYSQRHRSSTSVCITELQAISSESWNNTRPSTSPIHSHLIAVSYTHLTLPTIYSV